MPVDSLMNVLLSMIPEPSAGAFREIKLKAFAMRASYQRVDAGGRIFRAVGPILADFRGKFLQAHLRGDSFVRWNHSRNPGGS
jgi:hypothetical protein